MRKPFGVACYALSLAACAGGLNAQVSSSGVTFDRLLHADREPQNWLTWSGSYDGNRYSALTGINAQNVASLSLQWAFQSRSIEKFESTPLVVDGVMYITQAPDDVVALDAVTGQIKWLYSYSPSRDARPCCGRVNRGVAIFGNTLYLATIDAHLIALNARDGKMLWDKEIAKAAAGYAMTLAPLVIKDKVLVGVAGGEYGIRGFIAAYEAATGKEAWKFYTIPGPGEPGHETWQTDSWEHGGASVWITGSYDPDLNLTYWGIGNPGPDWNSDKRAGDNLYSDSVVALDADTGKLKWHFQFTPHDDFDYDSTSVPVLADIDWPAANGSTQRRKVMMFGNRNGFFYTLDRTTGQFLQGKPYSKVTWATGLDEAGRPMRVKTAVPAAEGTLIYPGAVGATNWYPPSFSSRTGLFYIPSWQNSFAKFNKTEIEFSEGKLYMGGLPAHPVPPMRGEQIRKYNDAEGYGAIVALNPKTGQKQWEFKMRDVTTSGILTTASDLLFVGGREGYFHALDARDGKLLWKVNAGGEIAMGPMTYSVGGKQYVAFSAGSSLFVYGLQ